jgi:tetratricopeptide (TPR) repeat protein
MDHPPDPPGASSGSTLPDAKTLADAVAAEGPLSRNIALALLDRGAAAIAAGEYPFAAAYYQRVVGFDDPAVTGAALLGLGEALYRLDRDEDAIATWESVLQLPENPSTYGAWRNVAAARVRTGDLQGALSAYREADRPPPVNENAEIASRLGWQSKELGKGGESRR